MEPELLKQTKRHFSKLGLMYFLGTMMIIVLQSITSYIAQITAPELMMNPNYSILILMLPMYIISMPLMALLIKTVPAVKIPIQHKMSLKQWLAAFVMCYGIVYVSNFIGLAFTSLIGLLKGSTVSNTIVDIASSLNPFVTFFIMVLLAPVAEEFIFRKLLIDRIVTYGEGTAVLFSGLMFGLFHGNINQFVYAFSLGLFFGFIYVKTGKVIYTILMHMVINFMGSVASMLILNSYGYEEILSSLRNPAEMPSVITQHLPQLIIYFLYVLGILGVTITGIILFIVKAKHFTLCPSEIILPKGKRFTTTLLNIGMILFCVFWIVQIVLQLFV